MANFPYRSSFSMRTLLPPPPAHAPATYHSTESGLFLFTGPNPDWRNEADCGFQTYTQPDGSILVRASCGIGPV